MINRANCYTIGTHEHLYDFANPASKADPEYSSVDIGRDTQLFYKYKTGKTYVVFGFCKGVWDKEGHRVFELHIDCVRQKTVDLVKKVHETIEIYKHLIDCQLIKLLVHFSAWTQLIIIKHSFYVTNEKI